MRISCYAFGALTLGALVVAATSAHAERTLEQTIEEALQVAPERDAVGAGIAAGRAELRQSSAWPDPVLELRADDRIGRELGAGGREFTEVSFSQALPIGQIGPRRARARAGLAAERAAGASQQLELEHTVAEAFHKLQHATAVLAITRAAAADAQAFAAIASRRQAAGEVSRREALRLSILSAQTAQQVEAAEGEYSEAQHRLALLLAIPAEAVGDTQSLHRPPPAESLARLLADIDQHPDLRVHAAAQSMIEADLAAAFNARWPAIAISAYRMRDAINGQRESYTGVGLSLTVPLWDRRSGRIQALTASGVRARAHQRGERRTLESAVRVRHLHLSHLLAQLDEQAAEVLEPARELLALTRQGYQAGEVDLLALLEATTTAREAERLQQQLLADAWLETAALRHAAGRFLAPPFPETQP